MVTERILVVDDELNVCRSVQKILSRKGYVVDDATSAAVALEKLRETPFDLVITDLMMPNTSGLELLQIIREHYPGLEVIMITGYASIDSAVKATKLGAAGYLPKPFTPEELSQISERTLANRKTRKPGRPSELPVHPATTVNGDDIIDVDMPFSAREVAAHTTPEYVESLTHSDIPIARKKTADKAYCKTGLRECRRLVVEGRECVGECPIVKKEKARAKTGAVSRKPSREVIDVDMPFPISELERVVGPEYVNCLTRSDMPLAALWNRNAPGDHAVLVVDDEPIVCHSVRKILAKKSCAVDEAFDVDAALQKMKVGSYDLVILDLKMPKRSGMEVLRSIKAQWPGTPVIMVTGYGSIDYAVEATRLGALNFLPKPFTPEELTKAAEEVLVG